MAGLAVLSLAMSLTSTTTGTASAVFKIFLVVSALVSLTVGIYFASPKNRGMIFAPSRWRRIFSGVVSILGVSYFAYLLIVDPHHLANAALWPLLIANSLPTQFRSDIQIFQLADKWRTGLSRDLVWDRLAAVFDQPGLSTNIVDEQFWIEMGRDWHAGPWRHGDAARFMKIRPAIRLDFKEDDDGAAIEAYSQGRTVIGMYDVVQLAQEMSETALGQAREATS